MSGRPAASTTCIRDADWVVAWDARTRHVYRFHVDVACEGETITSSGLGYAGPVPGAGGKSQLPTFATAIAVLLRRHDYPRADWHRARDARLQGTCTENVIITRDDVTLSTAGVNSMSW